MVNTQTTDLPNGRGDGKGVAGSCACFSKLVPLFEISLCVREEEDWDVLILGFFLNSLICVTSDDLGRGLELSRPLDRLS